MTGRMNSPFASGSDAALEALLSETRAREPEISESLTARILADAARVSAEFAKDRKPAQNSAQNLAQSSAVKPGVKPGVKPAAKSPPDVARGAAGVGIFGGLLADVLRALGGLPAAAAFSGALALGVATGAAMPNPNAAAETAAAVDDDPFHMALMGSESLDILAADDPMEGA